MAMLGWTVEVLMHLSTASSTAVISNCREEILSSLKPLAQVTLKSA